MKTIFITSGLALAVTVATPAPAAHAQVVQAIQIARMAMTLYKAGRGAASARVLLPVSVGLPAMKVRPSHSRNFPTVEIKPKVEAQLEFNAGATSASPLSASGEDGKESSAQKDSELRTTAVQITAPKDTAVAVTVSPTGPMNSVNSRVPATRPVSATSTRVSSPNQRMVCRPRG
jgi:hypothetical protein